MPYDFEATFTQPLLAEIDAGRITNAQSWTNAITRHYVNTIKLGLPVGVAPVLPAPGLNPTGPPPPFTIGVVPFSTANSRSHLMYAPIHAYFFAKELKLQKGSIEATIASIKQLLTKIKSTTARIKAIKDQIKLVSAQLEQLPTLLKDLDEGIKLFFKDQVDELDKLLNSIQSTEFAVTLGPDQFQRLFSEELKIAQSFKQFSITDKASIARLSKYLAQQSSTLDRALEPGSGEVLAKRYLNKRLTKLVKEVLNLVQIPLQPNLFIDYANNLERQSTKFRSFARAIKQIAFIERFIRPRLTKLKAATKSLTNQLRSKLQPKMVKLQSKLSSKVQVYTTKSQQGKSSGLFKRAKKAISEAKKNNAKQIAKQTARIKAAKDLIKQSTSVATKLSALTLNLEQETTNLKSDLSGVQSRVGSLQNTAQQLEGSNAEIELSKMSNYMEGNGLGSFYQLTAQVMVQTKSNAKEVINLLEKRTSRYRNYGLELDTLGQEVSSIQANVGVLFGGKPKSKKPKIRLWIAERTTSLKVLLERIVKWLRPKISKVISWLKQFVYDVEKWVKKQLRKASKALTKLAANLVPTSSNQRDPVNKKNANQARIKAAKDKALKLKATAQQLSTASQALPAIASLVGNLTRGDLKLSSNQNYINKIANAVFTVKRIGQNPATQQQILAQQSKFHSNFNSLIMAESLMSVLAQTSSTLGQQAKAQFNQTVDDIKEAAKSASPTELHSVELIRQTVQSPPRDLKQIRLAGEAASTSVLTDVKATTKLVELEKRVLSRVRQLLTSILDNEALKQKYQQALTDGNTSGLFFSAYTDIRKIAAGLNKQQSLILMTLRALSKMVLKLITWIKKSVKKALDRVIRNLRAKLARIKSNAAKDAKNRSRRGINLDGFLISTALGLAARSFWTGASWTGPTASNHICLTIGGFAPKMRAKMEDGATGFVREMARGFQAQLQLMQGVVVPPSATGIPPLRFVGYR